MLPFMSLAVGASDHRGWAVVVCVGARDGVPFVADRRRIELADEGLERQPFHHADPDAQARAVESLVRTLRASIASHSHAALSQLRDDLGARGTWISLTLEEDKRELPADVPLILESQQLRIEADGALYRGGMRAAAEKLGVEVAALPRGSEIERAAEALGATEDQVDSLLLELGSEIGAPWRKEHKKAAAAAIATLGEHVALRIR